MRIRVRVQVSGNSDGFLKTKQPSYIHRKSVGRKRNPVIISLYISFGQGGSGENMVILYPNVA